MITLVLGAEPSKRKAKAKLTAEAEQGVQISRPGPDASSLDIGNDA